MEYHRKNFVLSGIGLIIFILCYQLFAPPGGSTLGLRTFWLCAPPVATLLAGGVIGVILGLVTQSGKKALHCVSILIFVGALLYAAGCLIFPLKIKDFYFITYKKIVKEQKQEKQNSEIKETIRDIQQENKNIPEPSLQKKPLTLVMNIKGKKDQKVTVKDKQPETKTAKKADPPSPALFNINYEGTGNPFDYGADELGGYIPLKDQKLLTDIVIKGIITLKGEEPVAILELKKNKKSFFVRKGNVIRLQEAGGDNNISEVYLQVKSIKEHEVEIVQQQRPDKVIIIR